MLLTITTTHRPATDLGYLLHKHPERVQTFGVPFGAAHVFYPEAGEERCTVALLLDVDPVGLVRRGRGGSSFALAEYVNDRPYVASSFLSVALVNVFKSAMAGTCKGYEELAASPIALEAALPAVPARGGEALVRRLFEPLGYDAEVAPIALDEQFPDWGDGRHVRLRAHGDVPPRGPAQPPLRAAAGARRRQALLGRRRRDREAPAPRRGLARRAPGARPDRAPLPQGAGEASTTRRWRSSTRPPRRRRTPTRPSARSVWRRRSGCTTSGSGPCARC